MTENPPCPRPHSVSGSRCTPGQVAQTSSGSPWQPVPLLPFAREAPGRKRRSLCLPFLRRTVAAQCPADCGPQSWQVAESRALPESDGTPCVFPRPCLLGQRPRAFLHLRPAVPRLESGKPRSVKGSGSSPHLPRRLTDGFLASEQGEAPETCTAFPIKPA